MHKNTLVLLSVLAVFSAPISSAPLVPLSERDASRSGFVKQNGLDAQKQNAQFATMKSSDSCQSTLYFLSDLFHGFLNEFS